VWVTTNNDVVRSLKESYIMPELSEVNIQVRYLRERCVGWTVAEAGWKGKRNFKALLARDGEQAVKSFLIGNTLTDITQRGKMVVLRTERGVMCSHLMFRGRWSVEGDPFTSNYKHHVEPPVERSRAFWVENTAGERLCLHTPEWMAHVEAHPNVHDPGRVEALSRLGPEVLVTPETDPAFDKAGWDFEAFASRAGRSRQAIKPYLLDQKKQAGLGNMYVCEALYRAQIDPGRQARELSDDELKRLHTAAQQILGAAIETDLDYAGLLAIYRRERDPEGRPVEVTTIGGRDTFWVPDVQR